MDDQGSIEQASVPKKKQQQQKDQYDEHANNSSQTGANNELKMTRICMRRFVNVFLALHRRMHLWNHRTDISADVGGSLAQGDFDCGIKLHHILAASDDFSKLSMYWDLMPAAKLNYIHDFRGYFNCISQVVYFHDQEYERRPQVSHTGIQCLLFVKCNCLLGPSDDFKLWLQLRPLKQIGLIFPLY
jgi:hypothetical protein